MNLRDDDPAMFSGHKALHLARARFRTAQIRFRFGEANLRRGGEYVTVIAVGRMVVFAETD